MATAPSLNTNPSSGEGVFYGAAITLKGARYFFNLKSPIIRLPHIPYLFWGKNESTAPQNHNAMYNIFTFIDPFKIFRSIVCSISVNVINKGLALNLRVKGEGNQSMRTGASFDPVNIDDVHRNVSFPIAARHKAAGSLDTAPARSLIVRVTGYIAPFLNVHWSFSFPSGNTPYAEVGQ